MPPQPDPQAAAGRKPRRGARRARSKRFAARRSIPRSRSRSPIPPAATMRSAARRPRSSPASPVVRLLPNRMQGCSRRTAARSRARLLVGGAVPDDRLGVPTVYCAPGDIRICHTLEERVPIDEYRSGILGLRRLSGRRRVTGPADAHSTVRQEESRRMRIKDMRDGLLASTFGLAFWRSPVPASPARRSAPAARRRRRRAK